MKQKTSNRRAIPERLFRSRMERMTEVIAHAVLSNPSYNTESINFSDTLIADLIVIRAAAILERIDREVEQQQKNISD